MTFHGGRTNYIQSVTLYVSDLARSKKYYTEKIGLTLLNETKSTVDLTADGSSCLISLEYLKQSKPKDAHRTGLFHFALLLPTREALANFIVHSQQTGLRISGAADHLVSEALYLADPDGHGIEIYVDRDPKTWHWQEGRVEMGSFQLDLADILRDQSLGEEVFKLPKETIMGHIHLQVSHLARAKSFYVDELGYQVVSEVPGQALFLSDADYHHHIGLNVWNSLHAEAADEDMIRMKSFTLNKASKLKNKADVSLLDPFGNLIYV